MEMHQGMELLVRGSYGRHSWINHSNWVSKSQIWVLIANSTNLAGLVVTCDECWLWIARVTLISPSLKKFLFKNLLTPHRRTPLLSFENREFHQSTEIDMSHLLPYQQHKANTSKRTSAMVSPRTTLTLQNLPPEIHLKIFDIMDTITSTCLGLTCKKFYTMHWGRHGKVVLYHIISRPLLYHVQDYHEPPLWVLIHSWMGPEYTNVVDGAPVLHKTVRWVERHGWVLKLRFMSIPRGMRLLGSVIGGERRDSRRYMVEGWIWSSLAVWLTSTSHDWLVGCI